MDDLACVWCEYAEMELRHDDSHSALKLMQRATTPPRRTVGYHDDSESVQDRVHKSLKVWSLYADLEESFGTFQVSVVYIQDCQIGSKTDQIFQIFPKCDKSGKD